MDKKSKILLAVFVALIFISVGVTYWRMMIARDYIVEAQVDCDPYAEECFVWECDPQSSEEGEACTGEAEEDVWYFKVARRNAGNVPFCDPEEDEDCLPFLCAEGEKDCEEEFCTEENMENYYATSCIDPVIFSAQNPVEEEDECLEEDGCVEDEEISGEVKEEEAEISENQEEDLDSGDNVIEEVVDNNTENDIQEESADKTVPMQIIPL